MSFVRYFRERPILASFAILLFVHILVMIVTAVTADLFNLAEFQAVIFASAMWGLALVALGFVFKNRHGGFAVFVGFIFLIGAVLFAAIYAAGPELFPPPLS